LHHSLCSGTMAAIVRSLLIALSLMAFQGVLTEEDVVSTPIGRLPSGCVHQVPSGSIIHRNRNGDITVTDESLETSYTVNSRGDCKERLVEGYAKKKTQKRSEDQDYDGWLAFTSFNYPPGFGTAVANFTVPVNPQSEPEVLYIFNGLQNVDWIPIVDPVPEVFDIIQPVLQYPSDEGSGWSVKSWYVTVNSVVFHSPEILVNTGDQIYGIMKNIGPKQWFINGIDPSGESTNLTVSNEEGLDLQPWAYNTLECYGCFNCLNEPTGSVNFTNIRLFDRKGRKITPTWKVRARPTPICAEQAVVLSASAVNIYFNFTNTTNAQE